jgi:hypothetical protein
LFLVLKLGVVGKLREPYLGILLQAMIIGLSSSKMDVGGYAGGSVSFW